MPEILSIGFESDRSDASKSRLPFRHRLSNVLPSPIVFAVGLGIAVGYANTAAGSWIEHALRRDLGLTVGEASYIVSAELLSMGICMTCFADFASRLPRKKAFVISLVFMLAVQIVSVMTKQFWSLILIRVIAGVLFGLLYSLAILSGAETEDAHKTFAGASAIALFVGTFLNPFLGFGSEHFGIAGVFLGLGAFCALFVIPILFLPLQQQKATVTDDRQIQKSPIDLIGAVAALSVMALMTISSGAVLLFCVIIAEQAGLQGSRLGLGLAIVSFVSAIGGIVSSVVGTRFGSFPPLAIGLFLLALSLALFTSAKHQSAFWLGITSIVTLFWFLSPYIFGLSAAADKRGRLASATGGTKILFGAVGAALGGFLESRLGLPAVGYISFTICVMAIPVCAFVCFRIGTSGQRLGR